MDTLARLIQDYFNQVIYRRIPVGIPCVVPFTVITRKEHNRIVPQTNICMANIYTYTNPVVFGKHVADFPHM